MSDDAFEQLKIRIPRNTPPDVRVRLGLLLAEWTMDRMMAANWARFEQSLIDNHCPAEDVADVLVWADEQMRKERAEALEKLRVQLVAEFPPSAPAATLDAGIDSNSGTVH